ncbi:MAG: hypothetical protein MRY49_02785 [Candidatus Pacebacteria bacterium]|nr:hypothetical protein [Candidatus Paceibacterota bacterium]
MPLHHTTNPEQRACDIANREAKEAWENNMHELYMNNSSEFLASFQVNVFEQTWIKVYDKVILEMTHFTAA